jgi:hypothetical protein
MTILPQTLIMRYNQRIINTLLQLMLIEHHCKTILYLNIQVPKNIEPIKIFTKKDHYLLQKKKDFNKKFY